MVFPLILNSHNAKLINDGIDCVCYTFILYAFVLTEAMYSANNTRLEAPFSQSSPLCCATSDCLLKLYFVATSDTLYVYSGKECKPQNKFTEAINLGHKTSKL